MDRHDGQGGPYLSPLRQFKEALLRMRVDFEVAAGPDGRQIILFRTKGSSKVCVWFEFDRYGDLFLLYGKSE